MTRLALPCALLALLAATPAFARDGTTGSPPERESSLVVYGSDPCPQSTEEEIVVCARRPEDERYRIPRSLREDRPLETSWSSRVEDLENASRDGRPNSCSVVGSYGQTGCTQQLIRQWYAERRFNRSRR